MVSSLSADLLKMSRPVDLLKMSRPVDLLKMSRVCSKHVEDFN
jgi:hypothetical protein